MARNIKLLDDATKELWARQHADAVQRMLSGEALTAELLQREVDAELQRIVAQIAEDFSLIGASPEQIRRRVITLTTQRQNTLRGNFIAAVRQGRAVSRQLARGQVAIEVGAIRQARVPGTGLPEVPAAGGGGDLDVLFADMAANSMAAAFAAAILAAVSRWRRKREPRERLAPRLRGARVGLAKRVARHAATQSVHAYNDEHQAIWAKPPTELGLPHGWEHGTFHVWTAILDRRTCPACFKLDGEMVPVFRQFSDGAESPLHPNCRCMAITVFVPELARKKLPGLQIDYAQLKMDVRDYFRGTSLTKLAGKRHARSYIESTIVTTSPETLTRKLRNRRGYRAHHP